jgi:hypothetical protein
MAVKYNYQSYDEMPAVVTSYIEDVADVKYISDIPLQTVNDFLNGLEEFEEEYAKENPL